MTELEQDIKRVLELVATNKKPSHSVKMKVLEQSKPRKVWRNLELPMVAILSLFLVVSTGIILHSKNIPETKINGPKLVGGALPQTQQSASKGFGAGRPAAMPFTHPIEIVAESYPVHPNQTFTIQSKEKSWNGKEVKLYCVEETESNDLTVFYQKVLPSNAQYIGSAVIDQGKWSFQWKAPNKVQPRTYNSFLVIAQSDEGTLSATSFTTILYDKLEVTPSIVKVGQIIEVKGTGFPVGDTFCNRYLQSIPYPPMPSGTGRIMGIGDIGVDLLQRTIGFQTNIGSLHISDGSFDYSFKISKINGKQITPGIYEVLILFALPGTAGQTVSVYLTVE